MGLLKGIWDKAGDSIQSGVDMVTGKTAQEAAEEAAATQVDFQQQALDYLKEREQIPQELREQALTGLGGLFLDQGGQESFIQDIMQSPLYQSLIGGRQAGEESILRSAAATGGLRSGNVQANLYDYNTQLENQALLQAYNQRLGGLQELAGLSSGAANIANLTQGIGKTMAQGQTAGSQARQAGVQNILGLLETGGQLAAFSDRRLKKNVVKVGDVKGWPWYEWEWNEVANKMGMEGESCGVLADDVYDKMPDAISLRHGFMVVDYKKIGIFEDN